MFLLNTVHFYVLTHVCYRNKTGASATVKSALQQLIALVSQFLATSKVEQNWEFDEVDDNNKTNMLLRDGERLSGFSASAPLPGGCDTKTAVTAKLAGRSSLKTESSRLCGVKRSTGWQWRFGERFRRTLGPPTGQRGRRRFGASLMRSATTRISRRG